MNVKFKFKDNRGNPTEEVKEFISYFFKEEGIQRGTIEVVSPESTLGRGADYFIPENGLLLETTYLIERADLARSAKWGITVNTLSKLIKEHAKFSQIRGLYSISTPENFGLKSAQLKNKHILQTKINVAVEEIIKAIIGNKKTVNVFGSDLKIDKVNDTDNGIYFSTMGGGRFINVASIFHENLKNKFEKANKQLSLRDINGTKVKKRVLLIVNKYGLLTFDWDLFDGLSYSYEELVKNYKNIDEIWFQVASKEGNHNKLLYKKSVFGQFENMDFPNLSKQDYEVFGKWFSSLEKLNDKKKEELIKALKILLQGKLPYELFPDTTTRIEMVRYGRWLAENGKRNEANWLTKKFLTDPDPADPPNEDKDDDGYKLHEKVKNATKPDVQAIHTVRGHLAWNVQLLALQKDYIKEAYQYTEDNLRNTKNLYLVLQWLFPLIEISNRRSLLKEVSEKLYNDFLKLIFELLKYSKYLDLAKGLVHVFYYYREVTTEQAKILIDNLLLSEDFEAMLLFLALFRERAFKEKKFSKQIREYDPTYAKNILDKVILSEDEKFINLKSGIAWNIWKLLSQDDKDFELLSPLIDKYLTTSYNNHLYHNFERIVEDQIDKHLDKCIEWFVKIIDAANHFIAKDPTEGRQIWLSTETGSILRKTAKKQPKLLKRVVEKLYEMWMMSKGVYIGGISDIFTSYKEIKNIKLREETKKAFQEFYSKMRAEYSKLEPVNFE